MGAGTAVPFHKAIIFHLNSAGAGRFLKQRPARAIFWLSGREKQVS